MEVMCLIAVLVNCALIGLSGQVHRMFPEMSTTQTILLIVALEVRYATFTSLDDTSSWENWIQVWNIRMTQDTKGGRTVYVKILPTMHFISLHLAVPIWCPTVMCTRLCLADPLIMCFLQHIMLSMRFIITCAIPDLPSWVATEMAKVEFARREACRRLSSTAASSTPDVTVPPPGLVIGRLVILCQYITVQQLVTNIRSMVRVIIYQNVPHEAGKITVTYLMSYYLCAMWSPKDIVTETALFRRWKNKFILETDCTTFLSKLKN